MRKMEIYFQDRLKAVLVMDDSGTLRVEHGSGWDVKSMLQHYGREAQGEALFDLLLRRLNGYWNAHEIDTNHPAEAVDLVDVLTHGGLIDSENAKTQPAQGTRKRRGPQK